MELSALADRSASSRGRTRKGRTSVGRPLECHFIVVVDKVGIDEDDVKRLRTLKGRRREVNLLVGGEDEEAGLILFLKIDGRNGMELEVVQEVVLLEVVTVPGSE